MSFKLVCKDEGKEITECLMANKLINCKISFKKSLKRKHVIFKYIN